ncbi:unnamed protein product [Prorocentrum cordatum]|uniref:Uncharacterized protein n=1 Tax=Prorocentrum cordatum TaxID=2364126 RepID=A0ABN9XQV5_9DINO|nr:unnamed protein product [Polarella glacialis]
MASVHLDAATPEEACGVVVDLFRHLLSTLGALLATTAGQLATQDAASSRSLPAIGKSLQRLWFETPCGVGRDTKEEAVWLCRLMAVLEGSRAGILSFYGAGLLVCDCLGAFAAAAVGEPGKPDGAGLDEAWLAGVWQAQERSAPADRPQPPPPRRRVRSRGVSRSSRASPV